MPSSDLPLVLLVAGMASRFGGRLKGLVPVGPNGESIVDLNVAAAEAAGFDHIVLVTRDDIRDKVEAAAAGWHDGRRHSIVIQSLPEDVAAAGRTKPLGTSQAVLVTRSAVGDAAAFGVANADDVYSADGFELLARHLTGDTGDGSHCFVSYPVRNTLLGPRPVSRALCEVAPDGGLVSMAEGQVLTGEGGELSWTDGARTVALTGDEPVSVNLFGFHSRIYDVLDRAVGDFLAAGPPSNTEETRLPDVVADLRATEPVMVLPATGTCLGITHPGDEDTLRDLLTR